LPVSLLSGEVHATSGSTGGDDEGLGELRLLVLRVLAPELEGTGRKVDLGDGLGADVGAEASGLSAEEVHHLGTTDAFRKTGASEEERNEVREGKGGEGRGGEEERKRLATTSKSLKQDERTSSRRR
jgi:hypothetical protein